MVQSMEVEQPETPSESVKQEDIAHRSESTIEAKTARRNVCDTGVQVNIKPRVQSKPISCNCVISKSDANCSPIKPIKPIKSIKLGNRSKFVG